MRVEKKTLAKKCDIMVKASMPANLLPFTMKSSDGDRSAWRRVGLGHLLSPALLAIFLLALVTLVTFHTFGRFTEDSRWVAHTHEVLAVLAATRSDTQDEETAQHDSLLANDAQSSKLFNSSIIIVEEDQRHLRRLTADNPRQQHNLITLAELTRTRRLNTQANSKVDKANDPGRLLLDAMVQEENRLLRQRIPAAEEAGEAAQRLVLLGLGLVTALLILVGTMGGQFLWEQKKIDAALRISKDELEQRVSERTRDLEEAGLSLVEREQRFRFLANAMPQIVWTARPDGTVDFTNERWHKYTGLTLEETLDGGISLVVHAEDLPEITTRMLAGMSTGVPYTMEYRLLGTDGSYRWHLGRVTPSRDETGEITLWVGTGTDIDDYKRVTEALNQSHQVLEERVIERTTDLQLARDQILESETQFRATIEAMQAGLLVQNKDRLVLLCNGSAERILGVASGTLVGLGVLQPDWQTIREDGSEISAEELPSSLALKTGQVQSAILLGLRWSYGGVTWLSVSAAPLWHPGEDKPYAAVSTFSDITDRRRAEEALRAAEESYRSLFENSMEGIFQTTLDGRIRNVNPALARMLGYSSPHEVMKEMTNVATQLYSTSEERERLLAHLFAEEKITGFEVEFKRRDGSSLWVSLNARLHRTHKGEVEFLEGTIQDITERRVDEQRLIDYNIVLEFQKKELEKTNIELARVNRQLETLATLDGLTGLKNHRVFQERLREEFDRARRYLLPLSLIMLDVDKFKDYNDTYGHPSGDEVLRRVARIIESCVRDCDFTARYGGEEFVLILPQTDSEGAFAIAERCRATIEQFAWTVRPVTASFGVVSLSVSENETIRSEDLLASADERLYIAKANGRNQVVRSHSAHNDREETGTRQELGVLH